jgi:hypothetical protein
MRDKL